MKKSIISVCSVIGLLTLLAIPAFAVDKASPEYQTYLKQLQTPPVSSTPERDQIENTSNDMSENYAARHCDKNLFCYYTQTGERVANEGSAGKRTTASTELKLNDNQFGQAKTILIAINKDVAISQTKGTVYGRDCENLLSSGTAKVEGQCYGHQVFHHGWRATSSGDIVQFHVSVI